MQGFPNDFVFNGAAVSNMYRHIGDAVPPLISYQLAHLACWMLTGDKPAIEAILLPETNLTDHDLVPKCLHDDRPGFIPKPDRSDAKVTIANINKDCCLVHGTWQL